jgi:hypothetical protein
LPSTKKPNPSCWNGPAKTTMPRHVILCS